MGWNPPICCLPSAFPTSGAAPGIRGKAKIPRRMRHNMTWVSVPRWMGIPSGDQKVTLSMGKMDENRKMFLELWMVYISWKLFWLQKNVFKFGYVHWFCCILDKIHGFHVVLNTSSLYSSLYSEWALQWQPLGPIEKFDENGKHLSYHGNPKPSFEGVIIHSFRAENPHFSWFWDPKAVGVFNLSEKYAQVKLNPFLFPQFVGWK